MRTISIQTMPNGFELETPTFGYWFKAGIAFTLGAGLVTVLGALLWMMFWFTMLTGFLRAYGAH
jgi:uncharacterized membrane protein